MYSGNGLTPIQLTLGGALPCGRVWLTRVGISVVGVLCGLLLLVEQGWSRGGALLLAMTSAVALHEAGHVLLARLTGGYADAVLLWPLGGLRVAEPGRSRESLWLTLCAGPAVSLLVVLICLPIVGRLPGGWQLLVPGEGVPTAWFDRSWSTQLLALALWSNWLVFCWNLLPVAPLDAGNLLEAMLSRRLPADVSERIMSRVGRVLALIVASYGILTGSTWIVAAGMYLLAWNLPREAAVSDPGSHAELVLGYDFSAGYTSLEQSSTPPVPEPAPGLLERYLAGRRRRQADRQRIRSLQREQVLDQLLAKVHEQGLDALTDRERRTLRRVAQRLREQHRS